MPCGSWVINCLWAAQPVCDEQCWDHKVSVSVVLGLQFKCEIMALVLKVCLHMLKSVLMFYGMESEFMNSMHLNYPMCSQQGLGTCCSLVHPFLGSRC